MRTTDAAMAAGFAALAIAVPAADGDAARLLSLDAVSANGRVETLRTITSDVSITKGTLPGAGAFSLVAVHGRPVTALLATSRGRYLVSTLPNGTPAVQRVDRDVIARLCGVGRDDAPAAAVAGPAARHAAVIPNDGPSVIRLAVFYSGAALRDFEDEGVSHDPNALANLREHVDNAVALINAMLVASRVDARVTSAGIERLDLPPSESVVKDVDTMNDSSEVAARRDALGADVAIFVRSGGDWDGFADVLREPQTPAALAQAREHGAYAAVRSTCIDSGFMCMVHEFAHLVGAAHDRASARTPGFFADSYGFSWDGDDGVCHADLMAYDCIDNRELVLSGPDLRNHGSPTGDAANDNAKGVRAGVRVVAGYR